MKKLFILGLLAVVAAEVLALLLPNRRFVLAASGAAVALVLLAVRWYLAREAAAEPTVPPVDDSEKSLRRWLSRTETFIARSESTRSDWDRHLRPMLARQFEMATSHKKSTDRAAFHATGRVLFGDKLWEWVDPENVSRTGDREPGPGREVLDEILQRLEQV